jgi:hypothetical protein
LTAPRRLYMFHPQGIHRSWCHGRVSVTRVIPSCHSVSRDRSPSRSSICGCKIHHFRRLGKNKLREEAFSLPSLNPYVATNRKYIRAPMPRGLGICRLSLEMEYPSRIAFVILLPYRIKYCHCFYGFDCLCYFRGLFSEEGEDDNLFTSR